MSRSHSHSRSPGPLEEPVPGDAAEPSQGTPSGGLFYDDDGVVHELAGPTIPPPQPAAGH